MPRRVFLLTPWFPNHPDDRRFFGYIYDSAAALVRRGAKVRVLVCRPLSPRLFDSFRPEWMRGELKCTAFRELDVSTTGYLSFPRGWLKPLTSYFASRWIMRAAKSIARRSSPEIIHAHTEELAPIAATLGARLHLPSVVTIHGLNTAPYFQKHALRRSLGAALGAVDRVLLVGEPLRGEFAKLAGRQDHFRVVHNGARMPVSPRGRSVLTDPSVEFISVSNLVEGKGIDIVLRALALVRNEGWSDWHYTIVGDGDERRTLEALIDSLGLIGQVTFKGRQSHDRVFELLSQADVFVLPSYREAFGIAYVEAMAAGLLTIGVRGQGPDAFIHDGCTGFLVEPRSERALANCILGIVKKRELARQIASAGACLARKEFTWDAHAMQLMEVYEDLLGEETALLRSDAVARR